jgi:hypothetical protein
MSARPSASVRHILTGAASGAAAAAVWAAAEPRAAKALGHTYSDVRLLGRVAGGERAWVPAGIVAHLGNGATFGAVLALTGPLTFRRAVGWVAVETVVTWPLMALADKVHPDRRSGRWPRLLTSRRIMAHEAIMHALFGLVMGAIFAIVSRWRCRP